MTTNPEPIENNEPENKELISGEEDIHKFLDGGIQQIALMPLSDIQKLVSTIVHVGHCIVRAVYDAAQGPSLRDEKPKFFIPSDWKQSG